MEYKTTLRIEGLPEEAQEPQTINQVIAALGGELIELLPGTDRWVLPVSAWLRDPCSVPKSLTVTVPAPILPRIEPESDEDVVKFQSEELQALADLNNILADEAFVLSIPLN